jgi:hypothetical protein
VLPIALLFDVPVLAVIQLVLLFGIPVRLFPDPSITNSLARPTNATRVILNSDSNLAKFPTQLLEGKLDNALAHWLALTDTHHQLNDKPQHFQI